MTSIDTYEFAPFRLLAGQRLLLRDGSPVKLGSRAFDLLVVLVRQRDRVVDKQELMDHVWPNEVVEEANLAVQVLALRKVLGRGAIATVFGRGYRFTQPVKGSTIRHDGAVSIRTAGAAPGRSGSVPSNLPDRPEELIGRDQELHALLGHIDQRGLVTLVGSGGVGKTRLAHRAALELLSRFVEGVWWVELAAVADPARVADSLARVLKIPSDPYRDAATASAAVLRAGPALVVLDNAEHLLDGVRALVTVLRARAPLTRLLITSQEPLRVPDETIMSVGPLSLPFDDSLDSARSSGAISLFEARARLVVPDFAVSEPNRAAVDDICRRLDGIPLAIELAAARLPVLTVDGLRSRLNERLQVLTTHPRAALPRHQTLRSTLEWSHSLLEPGEQRVYRRLGVFKGGFTLEFAQAVAQDEQLDAWAVLHHLGSLVDKSLVVAEGHTERRFRLLETARLYAIERLQAASEVAAVGERHARALDAMLTVVEDDHRAWRTPPMSADHLVAELDNARAALDWATAAPDDRLAIRLAGGCSFVFLAASLNAEYLQRVLPLRSRIPLCGDERAVGLFWARIALACSRNGQSAGLDAAMRAAEVYRSIDDRGRLYDVLTWAVAIGSRQAQVPPLLPLIEEAERLEQDDWPAAARSSFQWAKHRWLLLQGRTEEALRCAHGQAELLTIDGSWIRHVAWGANVADCELSLGRVAAAESLAATALQALDDAGIDENLVGHVIDALMVVRTLQGRESDAIALGRRARRLLDREGDDLRLLDTLALNATTAGRWAEAAQILGHVDAELAARSEWQWPPAAARRAVLLSRLEGSMDETSLRLHTAAGRALSRDRAFALAFGDAASVT